MGEVINIWGKPYCELPSGGLCDACCEVKKIKSRWGKKTFDKAEHTLCPLLRLDHGCGVYGAAPDSCEYYHCSNEVPAVKLMLIESALRRGLVTKEEADEAVRRI